MSETHSSSYQTIAQELALARIQRHDEMRQFFLTMYEQNPHLREAEKANSPFLAALPGALRRCSSLVWLATRRSERLALHPASAPKNGILAISASLSGNAGKRINDWLTPFGVLQQRPEFAKFKADTP